ncbi:replicative DNA helicase [Aquitalea sp. USM4]|uniref:replicative DNA helicase n=1 Tax=Aquitalea sp. USM4 TaxID=1590041 RepID=UPI00103A79DF|nr:replicative DNA helicase [Aquitalea sp. USM4]QBJ80533.1 replicative DNA helicase [Aquitalea sp. USM4]
MIKLHSTDSEQSVLGGLMIDPAKFDDVSELLTAADFYDPSHRVIFGAIESLAAAKEKIDFVTVYDMLERRREHDLIGGLSYLADMAQNTPSAANIMRYARIVADRAVRRRLISAGEQLVNEATEAEDVDDLIDSTLKAIEQIQPECGEDDLSTGADLCKEALAFVTDRFENKGSIGGIPTGFTDVDKRLLGLKPGDLIIVAGRPAMGKTVYALNVAEYVAEHRGPVLFISLEMSKLQLGLRQQANYGSIPLNVLQSGELTGEDFDYRLPLAVKKATESRIFCDFRSALSPAQVKAKAKAIQRKHGISMIVIDYLQKMTARGAENRTNEIRLIASGLKNMAKDLQVPVLALSQLSRKVEERPNKRPMMSDLRESGDIEQEADIIQFLYREEYYDSSSPFKGVVEVITGKQRMGEPGTDYLTFQGQYSRMRDADMGEIHRMHSMAEERPAKQRKGGIAA